MIAKRMIHITNGTTTVSPSDAFYINHFAIYAHNGQHLEGKIKFTVIDDEGESTIELNNLGTYEADNLKLSAITIISEGIEETNNPIYLTYDLWNKKEDEE